MIKFFTTFANISSYLAIAASLIFYIGIIAKSQNLTNADTYNNCNSQLKSCRISSVVFTLLAWFVASGGTRKEAIDAYMALSGTCSTLGYVWIVFAFISILLSLFLAIAKQGGSELEVMKKLRNSGFVMGAVFLFFSFILQVN